MREGKKDSEKIVKNEKKNARRRSFRRARARGYGVLGMEPRRPPPKREGEDDDDEDEAPVRHTGVVAPAHAVGVEGRLHQELMRTRKMIRMV